MKPIILKDKDTEYTLEFNREAIAFSEMRGFKIGDVSDFPMTKVPELFFYAFRMHHKNVARDKTDKILDEMGGLPEGFVARLVELYTAPFDFLLEGGERKNSKWTVEM